MVTFGSVTVLGVPIHRVDNEAVLAQIGTWIAHPDGRAHQICTVNPEFLVDAQQDAAFRAALLEADLRVADGVGVMWAAQLLGMPLRERVTGSDGIVRICERAAREGWSVYFLGAGDGVARRVAELLSARFPGLRVAGYTSSSPAAGEWPDLRARLAEVRPDVLFVAFGHPRQDLWIWAHKMDLPCVVALGVGGAFDFVAGITPRAPVFMRRAGMEWLHRLVTQPWRWRRMLKLPRFVILVLRGGEGRKT